MKEHDGNFVIFIEILSCSRLFILKVVRNYVHFWGFFFFLSFFDVKVFKLLHFQLKSNNNIIQKDKYN